MLQTAQKKSVMQKQIPTLVGLAVLVVALIAGLIFFKDGTGVFAPRATPQTTPKNVKVTNITDKSFTLVFFTDEVTAGFVKYGTANDKLDSQVSDDRDQLSGTIDEYNVHHITVGGLSPNTQHYFLLGTGSNATFDNNGAPFAVRTAQKPATPPPVARTVYGNVLTTGGTPAEGSVVFLNITSVGEMSSLVKASGSWAIPLSNARDEAGTNYATITDNSEINLFVQGTQLSKTIQFTTTVASAQPVADLTFGQQIAAVSPTITTAPSPTVTLEPTTTLSPSPTASPGAGLAGAALNGLLGEEATGSASVSTASATLTLSGEASGSAEIVISQPLVIGQVIPNVEVQVSIHSDNQIEASAEADENGEFQLDLAELGEELEPGEHTITYTYIDPETGEEVTQEHVFWVEDTSSLIAQAGTGEDLPYGTGSPYPMESPTPTPTQSVATPSGEATDSGETKGGTRSAVVSTDSGTYQAGNATTTLLLVIGGLFFITTGLWSWWVANQLEEE